MDINSTRTVDFSKISFKFRKLHAHCHNISIWETRFYSLLQRCQEAQQNKVSTFSDTEGPDRLNLGCDAQINDW
jgi:hypothetical protein